MGLLLLVDRPMFEIPILQLTRSVVNLVPDSSCACRRNNTKYCPQSCTSRRTVFGVRLLVACTFETKRGLSLKRMTSAPDAGMVLANDEATHVGKCCWK